MKKILLPFIGLVAVLIFGTVLSYLDVIDLKKPIKNKRPVEINDLIRVSSPKPNQMVADRLVVQGEARGTWFFEASFPVRILDGNGKEIIIKPAQAKDDWMTENFVPFEVILEFQTPTSTPNGILILQRDNPSGLPENDSELRIPIIFGTGSL